MKKQQHAKWIAIFAITIITALFLTSSSLKVTSAELAVVSVSHSPTEISKDTEVTVEITFNDDTNVSGVGIQYCSLVPEFVCHFPRIVMTSEAENIWNGNFTVIEESGVIGYEIVITLTNTSTLVAPDSIDYLGYDNIIEPLTGYFYFSINITEGTPTNSAPLSFGLGELTITFSVIIFTRALITKRRKNV
ncbi:MAG: hypothetical protein ACTSPM_06220 [Candidatus Heimdallarchaeota archaeon]